MAHLAAYPQGAATSAVLNISGATLVASTACVLAGFNVIATGAAGAIYDAAATGTATSGRQIAVIPAVLGFVSLQWPCASGVVVAPGASQVLAVTLA